MNIAFFSESAYQGKPTSQALGRTDLNWCFSLDAYHMNIHALDLTQRFDVGIYIIPKNHPKLSTQFLDDLKTICSKVGVMQESDQIYFQRFSIQDQVNYLHFVSNVDFILCHNEIDERYYAGLFPLKPVSVLPTLLLDYNVNKGNIVPQHERSGCMVGGTWCDWYSGQDSYIIAQEFNCQIFAPTMGRFQFDEDLIESIQYLPYQGWGDWLYGLSRCKYAVHLMRTYAAGSFQLACGYLKLPCLGWPGTDTQNLLFPELTLPEGDMVGMRKVAKHLYTNELFYNHVVEYAHKVYLDVYSEDKFKEKTLKFLEGI